MTVQLVWLGRAPYEQCEEGEAGGREEGKLRSFGERISPVPSSRLGVHALENLCYRRLWLRLSPEPASRCCGDGVAPLLPLRNRASRAVPGNRSEQQGPFSSPVRNKPCGTRPDVGEEEPGEGRTEAVAGMRAPAGGHFGRAVTSLGRELARG